MVKKQVLYPERIRKVPEQFSWVDHRLVREGHIELLSHAGAALYLFLTTVGDGRGLSYYSDASIERRLSMSNFCLQEARNNLIHAGLVAYKKPIYQVLALEPSPCKPKREITRRGGEPLSLGDILKRAVEA